MGRLGFEAEVPKAKETLWIDTTPRKSTFSIGTSEEEGVVVVGKEEGRGQHIEENGAGRTSEEVEILESAEKKQRFWKGRIRRASKAASDVDDEEVS